MHKYEYFLGTDLKVQFSRLLLENKPKTLLHALLHYKNNK